jgi:tetratricopeptide (TPR) repeat protein
VELQAFHQSMASDCFNQCWVLVGKEKRTEAENEEMRRLAEVSFWHWIQVEDHTPENISVGYWQLSMVYAISGRYYLAYYYADQCIEVGENGDLEPFYIGYGYEARARAFFLGGRIQEASDALEKAYTFAEQVTDLEWKELLVGDLDQIRNLFPG